MVIRVIPHRQRPGAKSAEPQEQCTDGSHPSDNGEATQFGVAEASELAFRLFGSEHPIVVGGVEQVCASDGNDQVCIIVSWDAVGAWILHVQVR